MLREIKYLIWKEVVLEWRMKYAVSGMLLYVISTIFVCYLSFKSVLEVPVWNALFWIIMLFASVNAVAKSFMQESRGRQIYQFTLARPQSIIMAKIIYNVLLMMLLSLISFLFYGMLIGNLVQDMLMFVVALLLGSFGFSAILTMMSAIAAQTNNNMTLMAILSFPIQLPMLIVLIRLSRNSIMGLDRSVSVDYILILLLINVIVVALSYILFPYLCRD